MIFPYFFYDKLLYKTDDLVMFHWWLDILLYTVLDKFSAITRDGVKKNNRISTYLQKVFDNF